MTKSSFFYIANFMVGLLLSVACSTQPPSPTQTPPPTATPIKKALPDEPKQDIEEWERLAYDYLHLALVHETQASDMLDIANAAEQLGNRSKATEMRRQYEENQKIARISRNKANDIFFKIAKEYPLYVNIDKVLFFLSYNLRQMGEMEDAIAVAQKLVREFPESIYAPSSIIIIADDKFAKGNTKYALEMYQLIENSNPSDSNIEYAMYKIGLCYLILGDLLKSFNQFEKLITSLLKPIFEMQTQSIEGRRKRRR